MQSVTTAPVIERTPSGSDSQLVQDRGGDPAYIAGMLIAASIAALHYLALALGIGSAFARGMRLRDLRRTPGEPGVLVRLFRADMVWGIAAALWIASGLVRAFGHVEKAPAFYTRNGFFWLKMGLFVAVVLLELVPMITFIRWRRAHGRGQAPAGGPSVGALIRINDLELAIVVVILFVATMMARGLWLF